MKKLHPRSVWIFFFERIYSWFVISIVFLVIFRGFIFDYSRPFESFDVIKAVAILFIPIILAFLWAYWSYTNYKYEITKDGFRNEQGIISKKYVTIPYSRIQNVDIYRGVLARILGLSNLHIQTAGASGRRGRYNKSGAEGRLPGITEQEALVIRDEIIRRAKAESA